MFNFKIKNLLKNSNLENELLLAHAIGKDRVFVLTHPEHQINFRQYWRFVYYLFLLHRGYSVAAITNHKEFFGLDFFVSTQVLIPRPETELIVQEVLEELKNSTEKMLLIDVGTGSGCIPISILKNNKNISEAIALDISRSAIKIAKKNILKHNVKLEILKSNLLKKISGKNFQSFDKIIITANLPYLTSEQVRHEPSIQREPRVALTAQENGLALYRQLLEQIAQIFKNQKLFILFEIDPSQTDQIQLLAKNYLPQSRLEIKKDLAGLDRILKIST